MKKSLKAMGVTVVLGAVFGLGTFTGANSDWKTEVVNEANSRISASGYNKKEELVNSDVASEVKVALDPTIQQYEDEVAVLLEEYYQLKLQEVISSESSTIEQELEAKKQEIYNRYVQDIDTLFGTTN